MWVITEDIEAVCWANQDYRRVLTTTDTYQLVAMTIPPGVEVGEETHHDAAQFVRIVAGVAEVTVGDEHAELHVRGAFLVPPGTRHNVSSVGTMPLRLLAFYAPPLHPADTVHPTRPDDEVAPI
jgi:mannose-6-phosphate isomerase-like protein (cupin superfamily)